MVIPENLQDWFWDTMDREGSRATKSFINLLVNTPNEDLVVVGPQVCSMMMMMVSLHHKSKKVLGDVKWAFQYLSKQRAVRDHPLYQEAHRSLCLLVKDIERHHGPQDAPPASAKIDDYDDPLFSPYTSEEVMNVMENKEEDLGLASFFAHLRSHNTPKPFVVQQEMNVTRSAEDAA